MLNIEELKKMQCDYAFVIEEYEVKKANEYIELMNKERKNVNIPVAGDVLQYTNKYGVYYGFAHIDSVFESSKEVYICENAYVPFILKGRNDKICFSTSGGAWHYIDYSKFKKVGTTKRAFCDWGSCGACGDGAFRFLADVNVWEYSEVEKGEPTTKTHYRYCVTELAEERRPEYNNYKYLVSENCYSKIAFRTDEEYEQWKSTLIIDKVENTCYKNTIYLWARKN